MYSFHYSGDETIALKVVTLVSKGSKSDGNKKSDKFWTAMYK